ncbi:MAG: CPBP family intramembrane glutamic endopeptidase [Candidatus Dormiibacterota bacterium]
MGALTQVTKTHPPRLSWKDAIAAWLLAWGGGAAVAIALLPISRHSPFPALSTYAAHAWFLAVALFWFFALHKRFPVGSFSRRGLRGWLWPCVVVGAVILASFPFIRGGPKSPGLVVAQELLMQAVLIGPTEEFVSRGLIQTALNNSIAWSFGYRSVRLKGGTMLGALLFGVAHLTNLVTQSPGVVLAQVAFAVVFGLVIGFLYDRTANLWGASIFHDIVDGLQAVASFV